jgi:tripartite-type tricarboxylate transporter receptor subunit TctC
MRNIGLPLTDDSTDALADAPARAPAHASRRHALKALAGAALALPLPGRARPPGLASDTVTIVVPFAPGGATDQFARLLAADLGARLGSRFVVENLPGASATIGTRSVAAAAADGRTLLYTTATPLSINPHLFAALPYDPDTAFAPIALTVRQPLVVVTGRPLGIGTLHELAAHLRRHETTSSYGSHGNGTASHIAAALFARKVGADRLAHIPYSGPLATSDLVAARTTFMIDSWSSVSQLVAAGRLLVLASCDAAALPWLPGVASVASLLMQEFDVSTWNGLFAPAGTPAGILDLLNREVAATMAGDTLHQAVVAKGLVPYPPMPRSRVADFVAADRLRWKRLIQAAGIDHL